MRAGNEVGFGLGAESEIPRPHGILSGGECQMRKRG